MRSTKNFHSLSVFVFAAALLFAATLPAFAAGADKLNGTWVVDVDASLAKINEGRETKMPPEAEAAFRKQVSGLKATIDTRKKLFIAEQDGEVAEMPISSITEQDGIILVKHSKGADHYRLLPGGRLAAGSKGDIILKKAAK